jgi:UDP-2,3-diacylglucosamine pyrophosphatase LpxH
MQTAERQFRTLFISDVHLGSKAAQAGFLLDFLRAHHADTIYLVGDIVDGWRLKRAWHWPQEHNDVVQKLLRQARKGTRIVYIAGNHDEFLRPYQGTHFGGIEVLDRCIHEGVGGRRYLVIHGDQFDVVVHNYRTIAYLGDWAYDAAIRFNSLMNAARRWFGLPYWCDLRPHPSRHHRDCRGHRIHEHRRLGGKLHRACRACGWPVRNHLLAA